MRADKDIEAQARESQRHQCKSCGAVSSQYEFLLAFARRIRADEYDRLYQKLVDCFSVDTAGDFDLALVQLIHVRAAAAKKARAEALRQAAKEMEKRWAEACTRLDHSFDWLLELQMLAAVAKYQEPGRQWHRERPNPRPPELCSPDCTQCHPDAEADNA